METNENYYGGLLPSVYHELMTGCFGLESLWSSTNYALVRSSDVFHYLDGVRSANHFTKIEIQRSIHVICKHLVLSLLHQGQPDKGKESFLKRFDNTLHLFVRFKR